MSSPRHRITLAGSEHAVEPGTTAGEALARGAAAKVHGGPNVIAARVNGELRDLAWPLADGDVVEPVDIASDDGHYIVRHSAAHVMAQAVQELFPQAKLGIGPPSRAPPTVVPGSTACSLPARVMRWRGLDTADSFRVGKTSYPMLPVSGRFGV